MTKTRKTPKPVQNHLAIYDLDPERGVPGKRRRAKGEPGLAARLAQRMQGD